MATYQYPLAGVIKQFEYYKMLGEKTFAQIPDEALFWQYNEDSNSIATIVKHLWGNMLSRWTNFLTTDGEKDWRNRDAEFENDITSKHELIEKWNEGWKVLLDTLNSLSESDLEKTIYIRNQGHTVLEAIHRQLAHYPYHVGQIVFIGKMSAKQWTSLSIPKGDSAQFNLKKFAKEKENVHFTDEFLAKPAFNATIERSIVHATMDDFTFICQLFDEAIEFQRANNYIGWKSYDQDFIKSDISNGLLLKMVSGDSILGIFSICFSDPLIWREKENADAIYLHRIILNQQFKGLSMFKDVFAWANSFAKEKDLKFIRMDTWAGNDKIISYYKRYGFKMIENYTTPNTVNLPVQHRDLKVALLEYTV